MAEVIHTRPFQEIAAAMRRANAAAEAVEKHAQSLLEDARRAGQALLEAQDACQRQGKRWLDCLKEHGWEWSRQKELWVKASPEERLEFRRWLEQCWEETAPGQNEGEDGEVRLRLQGLAEGESGE